MIIRIKKSTILDLKNAIQITEQSTVTYTVEPEIVTMTRDVYEAFLEIKESIHAAILARQRIKEKSI